jgi:hypothetical protein
MRAQEFLVEEDQKGVTINIPITITIPAGGGMPSVATVAAPAGTDLPDEPVMVPPLQQELELMKQQGGKKSKIINQIVSDNGGGGAVSEESDDQLAQNKRNYYNLAEDFDSLLQEFDNNGSPNLGDQT